VPSSVAAPRGRYVAVLELYVVEVSTTPVEDTRAMMRVVTPVSPQGNTA